MRAGADNRRRQAARSSATAGFAAAAAFAALPLIQQLFSVERPALRTKVLLVVGSGLIALALDRLRTAVATRSAHADRQERFRRALRAWPLPTFGDAEPHHLGVFPARRAHRGSEAAAESYVARQGDPGIQDAIGSSFLVLLYGPRLAGKSRTAFELARRALPDARVAAPETAGALLELLAPDSPLRGESGRMVVWLDGLERFVDTIDGAVLDDLRETTPGVSVVATVRTDEWEEMLRASGQHGEAAKAVAARARAFRVERTLTPTERAAAEALYGDANLDEGIGAGVAATGKESDEPAMPDRPAGADDDPAASGPALLDPYWLGSIALALVAFALIPVLGASEPPARTLGERLDALRTTLSRGTRDVAQTHTVDLRGPGTQSYVFSIQDRGRSHELVVYDVDRGKLVGRLDFRPRVNGATFHFLETADVDGDGADELVGAYQVPRSREELVPFMLDREKGAYRLVSLTLTRTKLARHPARVYRAAYSRSVAFAGVDGRSGVRGYPAQDFGVTRKPYRLVAAYYLRGPRKQDPGRIEVHGNIFATASFASSHGPLTPCSIRGREPIVVTPDPAKTIGHNALDAWRNATRGGRDCAPAVARGVRSG